MSIAQLLPPALRSVRLTGLPLAPSAELSLPARALLAALAETDPKVPHACTFDALPELVAAGFVVPHVGASALPPKRKLPPAPKKKASTTTTADYVR